MKACHDQKTNLVLDIYDELDAEARLRLERHLKTCSGCRQERQQLLNLLETLKTTMDPPDLSSAETKHLVRTLKWKLKQEPKKKWLQPDLFGRPMRLVPAMAATFILIVFAGLFGYTRLIRTHELQPVATMKEEQVINNDLEILKNLDLLKEMDAIQKLVKVVDDEKKSVPSHETKQNTGGMKQQYQGKLYA
jgi:hypothetical protein